MPQHEFFKGGEWNAVCDQCGLVYKSSQLRRGADGPGSVQSGMYVCEKCYDLPQPQAYVRGKVDKQQPPWVRHWTPVFTDGTPGWTIPGSVSIAVGASPFSYTATDAMAELYVIGGTVSNIAINGQTLYGITNVSFMLAQGDIVVVTYSVAPTMAKYVMGDF